MRRMLRGALIFLLVSGCDGLDRGSIGCGGTVPIRETAEPETTAPLEQAEPEPESAAPPETGRTLTPTRELALSEAFLSHEVFLFGTVMERDLDGDGDLDAITVAYDDERAGLVVATREGASLTPRNVGMTPFALGTTCAPDAAAIEVVSGALFNASLTLRCEEGEASLRWLASVEQTPRVRDRITIRPPTARTPGPVRTVVEVRDRDEDQHADLIVTMFLADESVPFTWLDRPSGFARERAEPERTLGQMANVAKRTVARAPETALTMADKTLSLYAAFCREAGDPRVSFGDSRGLECGSSAAAGRAEATRVVALAKTGDTLNALSALSALTGNVSAEDREWAQASFPASADEWRKLADHATGDGREVRLGTLWFEDNTHLVARGPASVSIDLTSGESTVLPALPEPPIVSGELAVLDVRRTCAGYSAIIVGKAAVTFAVGVAQQSAAPLIVAAESLPECDAVPNRPTEDHGGWTVLGWAPQGLVTANARVLRIVPVTARGLAAGEPTVIPPGTPAPAPIRGAGITADGSRYVVMTPRGVLLVTRAQVDGEVGTLSRLIRPEGFEESEGALRAVAISPDGTKLAILKGDAIYLVTL